MYFFWTEVRFIVNQPEGLTLRIYLTSEKEQIIYKCNSLNFTFSVF